MFATFHFVCQNQFKTLNVLKGRELFFLSYANAEFDEALTAAMI